jgi:hypothetical protein
MSPELKHHFRQSYKPSVLRAPPWLRRLWLWL